MLFNKYGFRTVENSNCFEDETVDILYFPITDSADFPCDIRTKAEELIKEIILEFELNGCKLSILDSRLNARIISYMDSNKEWKNEISVLVASDDIDMWTEKTYIVNQNDGLYQSFKTYFMEQLENRLFTK